MSAPKIPYPPSPSDIPDGLTEYPDSFVKQQSLLLAALFVFLIFYIAMVVLCAMVGVWCALTFAKWPVVKVIGMVLCGTFFLFLVKGFFKRQAGSKEMHVEITEDDHPVLFGFIHQLCDEIDAPEPNKVFVSPDVNAACMSRTSLINLFVEPKRDLLIGLGLVNAMNLSEFKAVLAHEFGHFCHLGKTSSYTVVVKRIIFDLVEGEDWFDRLINWCKAQENVFSVFGHVIGACLWLGRKILWWILKTITLQDRVVSREQEFHADLVAVSAAGSDASTHGLLRARFGMQCFMQAVEDLATALDHKLYTNDLYLHQDRAAPVVRRKKKEPDLGLPPELAHPLAGKAIKVFDAEQDELEDDDDTPPMWRTHPADADREVNAKERFVPAAMDHRSPWILFAEPAELRERMTYKFYRMYYRVPKNADLADAKKVQEYIDNEYSETTYDPKYHGVYDDRPLEPGELSELNSIVRDSPWSEDRMEKVFEKLFDGCREHSEAHADLHKDLTSLNEGVVGKPSPKTKRKIEEVEKKLDDNWEWFKSFDRRVYLLHVQMAAQVNAEWKTELIDRYRFQVEVQRFYQEARNNYNKADAFMSVLFNSNPNELSPDFAGEVIQVLRESWKALKKIVRDAKEINLPAMKNFEEGERLADFILPGKMVPEPPLSYVKGAWIDKLMKQLHGVRSRCFRLHFKSVGGILALQEKIADAWTAARAPVLAEVVELVAVDAVPVELVADDIIAAEVIPEGVIFEALELDAIPVEVLPADSPGHDARAESMAPSLSAFVSSHHPAASASATWSHASPPAAEVVADPAPEPEAVFVFDAYPPQAIVAEPVARPAPASAPPSAEIFSLDASEEPRATGELFTLDADELAAAHTPKPPSAVVPQPADKPAGSSAFAALETQPMAASNGKAAPRRSPKNRPAVRITFVKPGEKSPFAK